MNPTANIPWLSIAPIYFAGAAFGFMVLRYLALGVIPYLYLYRSKRKNPFSQMNKTTPGDRQVLDELISSLKSLLIFNWGSMYAYFGIKMGWIQVYTQVSDRGWLYYFASIAILLLIQDTWVYWTHRLLHTPAFFKWSHRRHHQSVQTTPLTAYSFDAFEAITHAAIAVVAYSWFPVHPSTFIVFQLAMALQNLNAHSGFDWIPEPVRNSALGGTLLNLWVCPRNHHLHHQKGHGNYSLYFTFWDRMMGTYLAPTTNAVSFNISRHDLAFSKIKSCLAETSSKERSINLELVSFINATASSEAPTPIAR